MAKAFKLHPSIIIVCLSAANNLQKNSVNGAFMKIFYISVLSMYVAKITNTGKTLQATMCSEGNGVSVMDMSPVSPLGMKWKK